MVAELCKYELFLDVDLANYFGEVFPVKSVSQFLIASLRGPRHFPQNKLGRIFVHA